MKISIKKFVINLVYKSTATPSFSPGLNAADRAMQVLNALPEITLADLKLSSSLQDTLQAIKFISSIPPMSEKEFAEVFAERIAELKAQRELDAELYGPLEDQEDSPYKLLNLEEKIGRTLNEAVEAIAKISIPFKHLVLTMKQLEQEQANNLNI